MLGAKKISPWALLSVTIGIYFYIGFFSNWFENPYLPNWFIVIQIFFLPISLFRKVVDIYMYYIIVGMLGVPLSLLISSLCSLLFFSGLPILFSLKGLQQIFIEDIKFKLVSSFLAIVGILIGCRFFIFYLQNSFIAFKIIPQ
jgi:hypothetical protein